MVAEQKVRSRRTKAGSWTCSSANAGQCRQAASRRRCESDPQAYGRRNPTRRRRPCGTNRRADCGTDMSQGADSWSNEDDPAGTCFETNRETDHGQASATSGRSRTSRILKTTQQVVNTSVQHIKIPQVSDIPVVAPRQILPMTQTVQKTTEIPQLQFLDQVVDVPLAFVVLVPQMQVVPETVEISQLDVVEQSASTAPVRQMAQSEVVEAIEIGVKTIDLECVKVHPAGLVKPDDPDTQIKFPRGRNTSRNTRKPFCQRIEKEGLCDGRDVEEQTSIPSRSEQGGFWWNCLALQAVHWTRSHETTRVWDSACRRYGSACLEDGRIDRSPQSDFLEDGQGSRQRAVPCISEQ